MLYYFVLTPNVQIQEFGDHWDLRQRPQKPIVLSDEAHQQEETTAETPMALVAAGCEEFGTNQEYTHRPFTLPRVCFEACIIDQM